ncbi:MAG: C4-dicarboxylate transporter/malic acid transport protein [Deltaproteobacteria bacterium]|nr:C4-dicarboxylate transporter/malic acid transport protein [Deltaproteobacteria bacterium]
MIKRQSESHATLGRVTQRVERSIETLHPSYFAAAMATGIVSIACWRLGLLAVADLLFWVNIPCYCLVWLATIARAVFYRDAFLRDWTSHARGPGFFTSVAATCVVGLQFLLLRDDRVVAMALWCLAATLWMICTYAIFVALSIREDKPSLADGINGGWLLAVVATQSVCVLGCAVLPHYVADRNAVAFVLTACWLCGGMLYIWMISLIFYRYTFFRFLPSDLMPPYWINMGAVAISTLAGTALLGDLGDTALIASIKPFVQGFTILYWATATWWIPMLLVLGIWRHFVRRIPLTYDPLYWGLVFPLGMYSVCTLRLVATFELSFLIWVSRGFAMVALAAWLLTFFGLLSNGVYLLVLTVRSVAQSLQLTERSSVRESLIGGQTS